MCQCCNASCWNLWRLIKLGWSRNYCLKVAKWFIFLLDWLRSSQNVDGFRNAEAPFAEVPLLDLSRRSHDVDIADADAGEASEQAPVDGQWRQRRWRQRRREGEGRADRRRRGATAGRGRTGATRLPLLNSMMLVTSVRIRRVLGEGGRGSRGGSRLARSWVGKPASFKIAWTRAKKKEKKKEKK